MLFHPPSTHSLTWRFALHFPILLLLEYSPLCGGLDGAERESRGWEGAPYNGNYYIQ